jgi:hypothetical protein
MVIQMPFEAIVMQNFEAIARVNEILLGRVEFHKLAPRSAVPWRIVGTVYCGCVCCYGATMLVWCKRSVVVVANRRRNADNWDCSEQ